MDIEEDVGNKHSGKNDKRDFEEFCDEIEEDKKLRKNIDLYRDEEAISETKKAFQEKLEKKKLKK